MKQDAALKLANDLAAAGVQASLTVRPSDAFHNDVPVTAVVRANDLDALRQFLRIVDGQGLVAKSRTSGELEIDVDDA